MKHFFYFICLLVLCAGAKAQNVGIGTTTPTSKLTVVNSGVGIEHNDGTISIKSTVGFGIGMFGTASNHPFNLTANNTAGQLVIMPTGTVGIGNFAPTLAGLVADKKIGAVNAMFGSNTTGLAFESDWPGIGFNSYYNNGRKYIATGYGGVIGFNPTNGNFTIAGTAFSGAENAVAATNDLLTATPAGYIGIGTSAPTAKLNVNGTFKLTDGTQGAGKVLTSDASGNASWRTADAGNTDRFEFQLTSSGSPYVLATHYNFSTSASVQSSNGNMTITFAQAGLYHFDISASAQILSNVSAGAVGGLAVQCSSSTSGNFGIFSAVTPYEKGAPAYIQANYDKSIDLYIASGGVVVFSITGSENQPAANGPSSFLTVNGHLISQ